MTGLRSSESHYDRLFDKALSYKYNLSIRFEPDGLFFTVYDTDSNKYIGYESALLSGITELFRFIKDHDWLTHTFNKTLCIIPSVKYTIVPGALFIPQEAENYFKFVHNLHTDEVLVTSHLASTDAYIIYSTEIGYPEIIKDHFPVNSSVIPQVASLIEYIVPVLRNQTGALLTLGLGENDFNLLLVENGKMIYCNSFPYSNAEDLVYYVIFVIDQLKVNAEKLKVNLCGDINQKSEVIRLLRKYIRTVDLLKFENQAQLSYALGEIEMHKYPDLFNPRLCEL